MYIPKEKLRSLADSFGVQLDETALERFDTYARLLAEWNEKINLTAITDPMGITVKHFADSLSVFRFCSFPQDASVIDVGTGAGFPGLALLIARPDLRLTLLDSTKKKLGVIENILAETGLSAELLHARAEEAGQNSGYRESFDFATARAVANLRELAEYCLPFVKRGGCFVSMKGSNAAEELDGAKKAIAVLGGKVQSAETFTLEDAGERCIITIKKNSSTPAKYPRPSAKIAKNPLE